jgi:hypothetical protein
MPRSIRRGADGQGSDWESAPGSRLPFGEVRCTRRDPRGGPATALRPPDRPGGGRGRSRIRRAGRVAAHLLAADPAGNDWVVSPLSSAARTAIANGAPDSALAYLWRALAEPPSGRLRLRRPAPARLRRVVHGRPAGPGSSQGGPRRGRGGNSPGRHHLASAQFGHSPTTNPQVTTPDTKINSGKWPKSGTGGLTGHHPGRALARGFDLARAAARAGLFPRTRTPARLSIPLPQSRSRRTMLHSPSPFGSDRAQQVPSVARREHVGGAGRVC